MIPAEIESAAFSMSRKRSTTELRDRYWQECGESNPILKVLEARGLPVSFTPAVVLVPSGGIEPPLSLCKSEALPLS